MASLFIFFNQSHSYAQSPGETITLEPGTKQVGRSTLPTFWHCVAGNAVKFSQSSANAAQIADGEYHLCQSCSETNRIVSCTVRAAVQGPETPLQNDPPGNTCGASCKQWTCEGSSAVQYSRVRYTGINTSLSSTRITAIGCDVCKSGPEGNGVLCTNPVGNIPSNSDGSLIPGNAGDANVPIYEINGYGVSNDPSLWTEKALDFDFKAVSGPDEKSPWTEGNFKQGLRIDQNVGKVMVAFKNLGKDPYWVCGLSDTSKCNTSSNKGPLLTKDGTLYFMVCGDGKEALKGHQTNINGVTEGIAINTTKETGCIDKDYFFEGFTYHLSLFSSASGGSPNPEATFFVKHSYPLVKVSANNTSNFTQNVPISVALWGWRTGKQDNNNYQIVLEGLDHNYKKELCVSNPKDDPTTNRTVGINSQWVNEEDAKNPINNHLFDGTGWEIPQARSDSIAGKIKNALPAFGRASDPKGQSSGSPGVGSYVLKINERIHEPGRSIRTDDCQGGYTYMHVYFTIDPKLKSSGDINNNPNIAGIKITDVQYDPNNADFADIYGLDAESISKLTKYCKKEDIDTKTGLCNTIQTAIGPIDTTPQGFVRSIFRLVLWIAGFAAVIIVTIAGYIFITSQGNKEKISSARETLTAAIVGLLFIILSIVILEIIGVDILQIPGFAR